MRGHAQPCVMCLFNGLFSPQPASLASSPCITQSGCHPGISAMFHVLACACTCALAFRMSSPALTAPGSACMCWSFGDPWYLCYLADCMCQRLVTPLKCTVCASVCRLVCYEVDRLRGHMVKPSQVDSKPVLMLNIRPCLLLIRRSPYTILWIWDHMTTDHKRWYFILNH